MHKRLQDRNKRDHYYDKTFYLITLCFGEKSKKYRPRTINNAVRKRSAKKPCLLLFGFQLR